MIAPVQLPILSPGSALPDDSLPPVDSGPTASPATASPEAPDLIPARMLNEFTYCPRLGYLEFVQGEFADNLETLEGTFGHRRVDQASRSEVPAPLGVSAGEPSDTEKSPQSETAAGVASTDETSSTATAPAAARSTGKAKRGSKKGSKDAPANADIEPIHARSVMLSAPIEGLIAKMDLLEMEGNVVTPVDYKRGSIPDLPEGAWEPERVQLCAQGLILREAGYQCDSGVLYYIESRRRVVIPFDEALIARTRELATLFRQTAAAGVMPPPLVESPKCPRCSLVGICLPDETNLLTHPGPASETTEVRRLLRPRRCPAALHPGAGGIARQRRRPARHQEEDRHPREGETLQRLTGVVDGKRAGLGPGAARDCRPRNSRLPLLVRRLVPRDDRGAHS